MIGRAIGSALGTRGEFVIARLPAARIGSGVRICLRGGRDVLGRVVAIDASVVTIAPFGSIAGLSAGDRVVARDDALHQPLGTRLLGRAVDATGRAIDGGPGAFATPREIRVVAPAPQSRAPVSTPAWTGVRAIDGLLTFGRGARVGIFAGPGLGKTTLLEMIAAETSADAVVVASIGERGREAQQWIARRDSRTTVVCATSDRAPAERARAAEYACAQAAELADGGLHVLLVVDSLARYASALREMRTALGEPVGRGGYPASVFADLAKLAECSGNRAHGSITTIATVLSDGPGDRDPVSDAARSLLDGHIVLDAERARAGRFPAIDVLASASRTMRLVAGAEHLENARTVREVLASLEATSDARRFGLGDSRDPDASRSVFLEPAIGRFLEQRDACAPGETLARLAELSTALRGNG